MPKNLLTIIRASLISIDILTLNLCFVTCFTNLLSVGFFAISPEYIYFLGFANLGWAVGSSITRLYIPDTTSSFEVFLKKTVRTYIFCFFVSLIYLYYSRELLVSRVFVTVMTASLGIGLLVNRLIAYTIWLSLKKRKYFVKRILIIGYNELSKKLASSFESTTERIKVLGFCEEPHNVSELSRYPILNSPAHAATICREMAVTDIYSTILPHQDNKVNEIMQMADQSCIRFRFVADFSFLMNRPLHMKFLNGMAVLTTRKEPLENLFSRAQKRGVDIIFSGLIILFVLIWLIPLIALLIKLDSKGPVFFRQKRSGQNNKPFTCLKFRSMMVNSDSNTRQARRKDDRLTRVGKFIRKTSLDELPQFFNVLRGDMSIVGPRPHMLAHTEQYSGLINKFMIRQIVKPGITGWAQINGYRGETRETVDMIQRVEHDIWYIENWNLLLDLKIIILTAFNLVKGEENAF